MGWTKKVTQAEAVQAFLVKNDSGTVNLEASVSKFRDTALRILAEQEAETKLVSECMTALFDQYVGATLNMQFIKSQTVALMGQKVPALKEPTLFPTLCAKVEDLLHLAVDGGLYAMKTGQGGGFYRVCDQATTQAKG